MMIMVGCVFVGCVLGCYCFLYFLCLHDVSVHFNVKITDLTVPAVSFLFVSSLGLIFVWNKSGGFAFFSGGFSFGFSLFSSSFFGFFGFFLLFLFFGSGFNFTSSSRFSFFKVGLEFIEIFIFDFSAFKVLFDHFFVTLWCP